MNHKIKGTAQLKNIHPKLTESLERLKRYEEELPQCDPAIRAQLLAAWKEQIMDDLVDLLRATNDVDSLSNVDRAIALSSDITEQEHGSANKSGPRSNKLGANIAG